MSAPHHPNKLAGLDNLRALAITLVFLFHYRMFGHPAWVDDVGSFGWTGVDLFFVLSGYLIGGQLFQKIAAQGSFSFKEFFLKRFFRIIPAYLAVLTIYFTLPFAREREALPPLWKFLTFTQNFGLDLRYNGCFSHAWSLCIEEQFYLLLPLIIILCMFLKLGKYAFYLVPLLFIAGFAFRIISWQWHLDPIIGTDGFGIFWYKYIYYPTYNRLDGLLVGVGLAGLFQFKSAIKERITRHGNITALLSLAVLTAAYFLCLEPFSFHASVFGFPLVAVAYGILLIAAVSPSSIIYKWSSRVMAAVATLSYSIYLSHKIVIHITQDALADSGIVEDSNLMFGICIINCLLAALVLRYAVEKPFLALRDRILRKQ